ncbi:MAG: hypothetical protein ACLP3C_15580 [Mycobacterium sp.]|uniref:hypothetical protein n=1 Tax=Mycobacterium sp. TaxID=1785 RepID=UPI003F95D1C2
MRQSFDDVGKQAGHSAATSFGSAFDAQFIKAMPGGEKLEKLLGGYTTTSAKMGALAGKAAGMAL